ELSYNPKPSPTVASRILRELAEDPSRIPSFLNVFQDDPRAVELVRAEYRRLAEDDESGYLDTLKRWLRTNTDDCSSVLESVASRIKDSNQYVDNQDELLALTKVDWYKAEPIVQRLYNDKTQKHAQVLATWALYRRALMSGGLDADKYRDELKAVVEDKNA